MSTKGARSRYLAGALTPPPKVAALLTPAAVVVEQAEAAPISADESAAPLARPARSASAMSADILPNAQTYFQDETPPAPPNFADELEPAASGHELRQAEPARISPRRITGIYSADEVRALAGELVSIESTLTPGRFLCTWLESESGAADESRLDGAKNGGAYE